MQDNPVSTGSMYPHISKGKDISLETKIKIHDSIKDREMENV